MKTKIIIVISLLATSVITMFAQNNSSDYFGQNPPGKKAIKFAPGIINIPNRSVIMIVFTPDGNECYFTCRIGDSTKIYYTKRVNNKWTEQMEASFSLGQNVVLSSLSADGNTLFYEMNGVWKVERTKTGWGKPQLLPFPITSEDHSYSETFKGVAYFGSIRSGGLGKSLEIWRVAFKDGQYQKAENLGPIINCTKRNLTPCVAPDGSYLRSYLIYTQSDGTYEHLCVSFKKGNNEWTKPVDMDSTGQNINQRFQNRPTLSPDGKYLFFNMHIPYGESELYWVSTEIINDIKKEVFNSKDIK